MAIKRVTTTKYIAEDGTEFDSSVEAEKYERYLSDKGNQRYNDYTQRSWAGKELLKDHALTEIGIWKVLGEDPNPDLGGPHHQPHLGKFRGTLEQVIRHAVMLPGFWTWGGGGRIVRDKIEKIIDL